MEGLLLSCVSLRSEVREKRHVARALDSECDLALLVRWDTATLLRNDLRVRRHELLQVRNVLVVYELLMLYLLTF